MLKAVLDVNVLISAFILPRGVPYTLVLAWRSSRFTLVTSPHIIDELISKLRSEKLRRYGLTAADIRTIETSLRNDAVVVDVPTAELPLVTGDPEDDAVLATALLGGASYLVTGDGGLRDHSPYDGIEIVSPRTFLELLDTDRAIKR